MTVTTTAPANLRIEDQGHGLKKVYLGDAFIGRVHSAVDKDKHSATTVRLGFTGGWHKSEQDAIDEVVTTYKPAPYATGEIHRETYRGVEFFITFTPGEETGYADRYDLTYNGKRVQTPKGDLTTKIKKVHGWIDQKHADEALLPQLLPLVDALMSVEGFPGWDDGATPKEGDVAYVYAQGRFRRGLVTKVGKTRATVSYTTASSQGRIYHKADKFEALAADPTQAPAEAPAEETAPAQPVTVQKDTTQLVKGDVVLTHGMRVLLDQEPNVYGHSDDCHVYAFTGTVTNLDEVLAAGHVPASFLCTHKWEDGKGWVTDRNDVWGIQGNKFATWTVEAN